MSAAQREFDIVLYGATGFVGKLTAQYLARAGGQARIALAGRSTERLLAVREDLGEAAQSWQLIAADASQPSTLNDIAARTQVVVTTVGPYTRYGMPLVAACAAAGTDYADLTGEAMFVRESIDLHHKQAADTGARIVHACGFDSIPSDLSVYALYRRAAQDGAGELGDTNLVVRSLAGGFSGGTIASMMEVFRAASSDPEVRRILEDPYTLSTDRGAEPDLGPQSDLPWRRGRDIAPELGKVWTAGFVMAPYNTRVVRRSNALQDWAYGRRFRYAEHLSLGSSFAAPVASGDGRRRQYDRLRARQPLLPVAAAEAGGTGGAETGHRPERKDAGPRPLQDRDLHHHDDRRPLCGHDVPAGRPRLQGDIGPAR